MELFTAINSPGTGARMREALKVLAKEWRRRGGNPATGDSAAAVSRNCLVEDTCPGCEEWHTGLVSNMPPSLLQRQLTKLGACEESIKWAGQFSTAREAWAACANERWMRWIVCSYGDYKLVNEMSKAGTGVLNSPEALAACRRVVPFERLRELSRGK